MLKSVFGPLADREAPDQPAHPIRLITTFAVYKQNNKVL